MTAALSDMSLAVHPGEIHAIVGENGAGKSTLIKIMTGVYQPDSGEIRVDGKATSIRNTQAAQSLGIAAIFQEPMVFPDLDVAENIFISHRNLGVVMNWGSLYRNAAELISRLGVALDVRRAASGLTLAEQQTVEIARALSLHVKVLIMDEPTASLSAREVDKLLEIARALKEQGVAVLYISHRLDEIFRITDRVTVLRDGRHISTKPISAVTHDSMVKDMVGRAISDFAIKTSANPHGERLLSVKNLSRAGVFRGVSFDLHKGEVLCLAGLIGPRRTDVGLALFGIAPATEGSIDLAGQSITITTPQQAVEKGIAYVSEDRRKLGLAMSMPIYANISLASLGKFLRRFGLIDRNAENAMAESHRERLSIRSPDVMTDVGKLSGGNQQKVMLAKWLETKPRLLIFDEPTRGIDVGAKTEVHAIIRELAKQGVAILVISSDLPEVLALADRVLVMREGRQMGIFDIADCDQEKIIALATGKDQEMSAA
ncbi:MAG: sugar ABC transporter ATP-binding protein [Phyllobacteriaceae bacterium]|nr:sugar ABC transporter ATP-binding protein [Phyllobacteriaceae bacterium]